MLFQIFYRNLKDVCEWRRGTKDINLVTVSKNFSFKEKSPRTFSSQVILSVHGDLSFLFHFFSINTIFNNGQSLKKPLRWVPYFGGMNLMIQTDHVSDIY